MANNILNHKDVVISVYIDEEASFSLNSNLCDYENSKFCDLNHKNIIKRDLRIMENKNLEKVSAKPTLKLVKH